MADYKEKATLLVVDRSSKPIAQIRKELAALHRQALKTKKALGSVAGGNGLAAARPAGASRERAWRAHEGLRQRQERSELRVLREQDRAWRQKQRAQNQQDSTARRLLREQDIAYRKKEAAEKRIAREQERAARQIERDESQFTRQRQRAQDRIVRARRAEESRSSSGMDRLTRGFYRMEYRGDQQRARARDRAEQDRLRGRDGNSFLGGIRGLAGLYSGHELYITARQVTIFATQAVLERSDIEFTDRLRGRTTEQRDYARDLSRSLSATFLTVSESQIRHVIRELQSFVPDEDRTAFEGAARALVRAQSAIRGSIPGGAEAARGWIETTTKSLNILNITDPKEVERYIDTLARLQIVTGRNFTPQMLLGNLRRAGPAARGISPEALFMFGLLSEESGGQAGFNWRTAYQNLTRGTLNAGYKARLEKAGIGQGPTLVDKGLLQENPIEWYRKHLIPLINAMTGLDVSRLDKNDPEVLAKVTQAIDAIGFLPSGARLPVDAIQQWAQLQRNAEQGQLIDLSIVERAPWENLRASVEAVQKQFDNLFASTEPLLSRLAPGIGDFAVTLNQWTNSLHESIADINRTGVQIRDLLPLAGAAAGIGAYQLGKFVTENPAQAAFGASTALYSKSTWTFSRAVGVFAASQGVNGGVTGVQAGGASKGRGKVSRSATLMRGGAVGIGLGLALSNSDTITDAIGAPNLFVTSTKEDGTLRTESELKSAIEENTKAWQTFEKGIADKLIPKSVQDAYWGADKWIYDTIINPVLDNFVVKPQIPMPVSRPADSELQKSWTESFDLSGAVNDAQQDMRVTFEEGSNLVQGGVRAGAQEASTILGEAGSQFGSTAGSGLLGVAGTFGAEAGAAFRNQVGSLTLSVTPPERPADTGANINDIR